MNENIDIEKYIKAMELLSELYDLERAHEEADDLLVKLLKELGFNELIEAYEKIGKWYA